ncbi:MAG: hypothetical protein AAF525_21035, partial [Pseudomonadota bacterium]
MLTVALLVLACDSNNGVSQWSLPVSLAEISGMAYYDNALLVHDDERGDIYRIGLPTQTTAPVIDLMYRLEEPRLRGDFEGIAIFKSDVYVTTSKSDTLSRLADVCSPINSNSLR